MFFNKQENRYPHPPKVKICGVRNSEVAEWVADAGADAIGLMFYEHSVRHVSLDAAREISKSISGKIDIVGVFVNPTVNQVNEAISMAGLTGLQFHGDETPEFCHQWNLPWIKGIHMDKQLDICKTLTQWKKAFACLLDTNIPGLYGGSGKCFDWTLIPENWRSSIVLAGGLNPDNIAMAINTLNPFGVDVSSGVEKSKGKKSKKLIEAFMREVVNSARIQH